MPERMNRSTVIHDTYVAVDTCSLPSDSGPCEEYIQSYFYDSTQSHCVEFVWGGCDGNANRFASMEECEHQCLHTEEVETSLPPTTTAASSIDEIG